MLYKNAGIKSLKEAKSRLEAGEVFYLYEYSTNTRMMEIKYDKSFIYEGKSPYRFNTDPIMTAWKVYKQWQIKAEWYDNIPEHGVLCWVHDDFHKTSHLDVVISYPYNDTYPFETRSTCYKLAVPVTKEEVEKYYALLYKRFTFLP